MDAHVSGAFFGGMVGAGRSMRRPQVVSCVVVVVVLLCLLGAGGAQAAGWALQRVPTPGVPNGELLAVSCASKTSCMAVGSDQGTAGMTMGLAERWDGTRWSVEATPIPVDAQSSELLAVSCVSANACTAVGSYATVSAGPTADTPGPTLTLVEHWNGVSWSIEASPNMSDRPDSELLAVSCSSARACTAVGDATQYGRKQLPLAERWNGTSWSIQSTPKPKGAQQTSLYGVSCPSASSCLAVGDYYPDRLHATGTLAEHWNGAGWSVQATRIPSVRGTRSVNNTLNGVSCTSSSACTAVGRYLDRNDWRTLAERWNGSRWTIQASPNPSGMRDAEFLAVSCVSGTVCTALVADNTGINPTGTVAERWSGRRWSIERLPTATGATNSLLTGVSCLSASRCTAVGDYQGSTGTYVTLAEGSGKTGWAVRASPNGYGITSSVLNAVSCASENACAAVGDYTVRSPDGWYTFGSFAERWNGTAWSVQPTPAINGSSLQGVSCVNASLCIAVGSSPRGSSLIERWNGRRWTIQHTASVAGRLTSVSCVSANACAAVGVTGDSARINATLAARWNGAEWTTEQTPQRPHKNNAEFWSVSCASTTSCTAVGDAYTSAGNTADQDTWVTLAEHWDGATWSIQPTPNGDDTQPSLNAVSCASATTCTAFGTQGYDSVTLAERWDGSKWRIQPSPTPADTDFAAGQNLFGISCASATSCTAVGGYRLPNANFDGRTLAEEWNGTDWSIQPSPNATGYWHSYFGAVSCVSTTYCIAVGGYDNTNNQGSDGLPLAERYS